MSKYTAEQVEDTRRITPGVRGEMLGEFAALLRERESAKAAVTELPRYTEWRHLREKGVWSNGVPAWAKDHEGRMNDYRAAVAVIDELAEAVTPMLASARVPDEKEDLDPVRLRREGRVATEWERGFNEGWNDCRETMLAAAGEPNHDA